MFMINRLKLVGASEDLLNLMKKFLKDTRF